jgi:16S rRNA G966 N2-methylase RsmD
MALSPERTTYVTVQQGIFRGRKIALPPALHGHRHFTSSLMKEALFQLIDVYRPCAFFDLCAGSGQIAVEALSRGFTPVHCVERDERRFAFLVRELAAYDLTLHKKDFRRMAPLIAEQGGVAFLDVPYSFWNQDGVCYHLEDFLIKLRSAMKGQPVVLALQSPHTVRFSNRDIEQWLLEYGITQRRYRSHTLSLVGLA